MPNRRALAWLLNWYRQSELEGALLLGRMVRHAQDPFVVGQLTRHAADEARHAWLWQRTITQLNLPAVRILRSYQSFYAEGGVMPQALAEVLALTHVFERRVDVEFSEQLVDARLPEPVLESYTGVDRQVASRLRACRDHLWDVPGLGEELEEAAYVGDAR